MRILLIEVENFLGHVYEKINIPKEGIIRFTGASGVGKSSLIGDAVGFALFGVNATRVRSRKIEDLLYRQAKKPEFFVRIAFENPDGTRWEIKRGWKNGSSFAELIDSNGQWSEKPTGVEEHRKKLAGTMNAGTYHRSFVAKQSELATLSDIPTNERRKALYEMLDIKVLDKVRTLLRARVTQEAGLIRHLEQTQGDVSFLELERKVEELTSQHKLKQQLADSQLVVAQGLETKAQAVEQQIAPMRDDLKEWQEKNTHLRVLKAQVPSMEERIKVVMQELSDWKDKEALVQQEKNTLAQGKALREEVELLEKAVLASNNIMQWEKETASLKVQIKETEDGLPKEPTSRPAAEIEKELAECLAAIKNTKERLADLKVSAKELAQDGTCSTCLRPATGDDLTTIQEHYALHQADLRASLEAEEGKVEGLKADLEKSRRGERTRQEIRIGQEKLKVLQSRLSELDKQLKSAPQTADEKELKAVRDKYMDARSKMKEIIAAKEWISKRDDLPSELSTLESQIKQHKLDIQTCETWLLKNPMDPQKLDSLADEERKLRAQAAAAKEQMHETNTVIAFLANELKNASERLTSFERETKALTEARARSKQASELHELTARFQQQLASQIRPQLEAVCSEIVSLLSSGKHKAVKISNDYDLSVIDEHNDELPVYLISGGEEVRLNFALRIALTRLITQRTGAPLQYLVLDEAFEFQDFEHSERMVETLQTLKSIYPQIFLISHGSDLDEMGVVDYEVRVGTELVSDRVTVEPV